MAIIGVGIIGAIWLWTVFAGRPFSADWVRDQVLWIVAMGFGWLLWLMLNNLYDLKTASRKPFTIRRILSGGAIIGLGYLSLFFVLASPLNGAIFPSISGTIARTAPTAIDDPITIVSLLRDITSESGRPPRLAPGMAVIVTTLMLVVWRMTFAGVFSGERTRRRVLILGAGRAGDIIAETLKRDQKPHFEVIGFVDDDPSKRSALVQDVPVLGTSDDLIRMVETRGVDEVIVAISSEVRGKMFQVITDCHERGITVTPMPLLYEQLTGRVAIEHIGTQWYVALPFQSYQSETALKVGIKRLFDLTCALLLSPVVLITMPLIALAIKLDSRGSVFYSQERMGQHGKRFKIYKYRTMVHDAEKNGKAEWAVRNDPRVTRIGKILRRSRLDEVPQLLNLWRGEMSMVGPRPERPQFIEQLQRQIPFFRTRLAVKPGLTGWAQINYGYGSTIEDSFVKLQYDLYYIKHHSIFFDVKVILRTLSVVLRMRGQ
jgi:exopolysaccharide biosynthesis polyprenyl glycosylphosphotransferase